MFYLSQKCLYLSCNPENQKPQKIAKATHDQLSKQEYLRKSDNTFHSCEGRDVRRLLFVLTRIGTIQHTNAM